MCSQYVLTIFLLKIPNGFQLGSSYVSQVPIMFPNILCLTH